MKIFLFDSLSRKKKEFLPIDKNQVRIYACGPTVYDYAHVGNARMAVATDLLVRVLKEKYKKVLYVSNITDVDDKIIKASEELKVGINYISEKFHRIYNEDMLSLNVMLPDIQPKATDYINEMIIMIEKLIENECAYVINNHVMFNVESYKYYGKLSRRSIADQIDGARVEVSDDKKNARDFILWKPSDKNQPGWQSPWGRGRPGWHIECSVMSQECLKTPFDIHCGGVDLTFPHHENEIAQSCSAMHPNSEPENFCRYWFHNGFVTFNGEKMSKSLGNIKLVHDLLKKYSGETIRLSLLSAHYRQPLNWTEDILEQSNITLSRIKKKLDNLEIKKNQSINFSRNEYFYEFQQALCDDLNTPKALSILSKMINNLNKAPNSEVEQIVFSINEVLKILGLNINSNKKKECIDEYVEELVKERDSARKEKNFERADEIRDLLRKKNIEIEDTEKGTKWTKLK